MPDHQLCGAPDRLGCCAHCDRNPKFHEEHRDDPWQSWGFPQFTETGCDSYVPREEE